MTKRAKPDHVKLMLLIVPTMMMRLWLAFLFALRAARRTFDVSSSYRIMQVGSRSYFFERITISPIGVVFSEEFHASSSILLNSLWMSCGISSGARIVLQTICFSVLFGVSSIVIFVFQIPATLYFFSFNGVFGGHRGIIPCR